MTKHLYRHAKKQDRYMHPPLIARDRTLTEVMMLTNAAILEVLGLIKQPNGKYVLKEHAKK